MNYSTNYNLNMPERNEQFNIDHWNENTSKIDSQMKTNANGISTNTSNISKLLTGLSTVNTSDTGSVYYKLMKLIYPVGSIYWSSKSTNPGTLFGGTWTQIKDKFVLACGDTYNTTGATGGKVTTMLTVAHLPSHTHTFTPSGTVASHSHTLNSHTHTLTPSGTVKVTTNPTFSGTAGNTGYVDGHKHGAGKYLCNDNYPDNGRAYDAIYPLSIAATHVNTTNPAQHQRWYRFNTTSSTPKNENVYTQMVTEGEAKTTVSSSEAWELTGYAGYHRHSFTPSGSISGGAYSFTGTQGTTSSNNGNTSSTQPSFTGTAGNTGGTGGGTAFSIMPPYIVKYCWERTA